MTRSPGLQLPWRVNWAMLFWDFCIWKVDLPLLYCALHQNFLAYYSYHAGKDHIASGSRQTSLAKWKRFPLFSFLMWVCQNTTNDMQFLKLMFYLKNNKNNQTTAKWLTKQEKPQKHWVGQIEDVWEQINLLTTMSLQCLPFFHVALKISIFQFK